MYLSRICDIAHLDAPMLLFDIGILGHNCPPTTCLRRPPSVTIQQFEILKPNFPETAWVVLVCTVLPRPGGYCQYYPYHVDNWRVTTATGVSGTEGVFFQNQRQQHQRQKLEKKRRLF